MLLRNWSLRIRRHGLPKSCVLRTSHFLSRLASYLLSPLDEPPRAVAEGGPPSRPQRGKIRQWAAASIQMNERKGVKKYVRVRIGAYVLPRWGKNRRLCSLHPLHPLVTPPSIYFNFKFSLSLFPAHSFSLWRYTPPYWKFTLLSAFFLAKIIRRGPVKAQYRDLKYTSPWEKLYKIKQNQAVLHSYFCKQ